MISTVWFIGVLALQMTLQAAGQLRIELEYSFKYMILLWKFLGAPVFRRYTAT
jgi:hypothetical protein